MNRSNNTPPANVGMTNDTLPIMPPWEVVYTETFGLLTSDRIVGSVFIFLTLVGLLGNGSAVCYFWVRRRKTVHDLLYLMITSVDSLTVSIGFPLIASLLNYRYPTVFGHHLLCSAWAVVFSFNVKMSIFLATMICVTRTLAMKFPPCYLSRFVVMLVIAGYAALLIIIDVIYLSLKWIVGRYVFTNSFCIIGAIVRGNALHFYFYVTLVEIILPPVVTFVCFVIGTWILVSRPSLGLENDRKFRRVSITISIFTAVFLVCNIPCVVNQILNLHPGDDINFYDQLLLQFFPLFLNAVSNPLLYLLRMQGYQNWIRRSLKLQTVQSTIRKRFDGTVSSTIKDPCDLTVV